ncbi:AMP-binding protein [Antrihabitans sp. YC3-6]|uniref:AMP-binding protein n=1 Tax=Antrihabitans stalagmiti TaxID=2799499 RepID=A0A934U2J0_9NOCA|nr:AMP-binding protein [Antrihabitans stalagmiti]MBJ8339045.1 AMP-binding protein [Antrihabitans stalagmiti]
MTLVDTARTGIGALTRSRLVAPIAPQRIYGMARAVHRGGANPATLLSVAAARWPNRAAVIDDDGAITYRELSIRTAELAAALSTRNNIGTGAAVGILCRNGRGFVGATFAAAATGADVVLLNTDFDSRALAGAIAAHKIRVVLCDSEFMELVTSADTSVVALDPAVQSTVDSRIRVTPAAAGRIVLLTSGTTGVPKGVPRTPAIGPVLGVGATILDRTGLRVGTRILLAVPMFHAFGFGILTLATALGGTMITRRRFDAEAALAQASLHRADAIAGVPIMFARIVDLPDAVIARNPLRRLRVAISGGAPLSPALAERFMETFGDILYNGYGSSEVGIGTFATPDDLRQAPGTVGRPVVGSPIRILDDAGSPVTPGVVGRIFVGGDLAFDGYTDGATKAVVDRLTSTGDMGYVDEYGRLFIEGRDDDMIVSGGENVYPRAVSNALDRHPDVADNAVTGVPDDAFGHRLAAYVVRRPGSTLDAQILREYLKTNASRFEQPRDIHIVSEIPRNPAGKVLKRELLK